MRFISDDDLNRLDTAETGAFDSPVPTQIISNGEFNPPPQTEKQKQVERRLEKMADELGPKHGLNRRQFLRSAAGMAAAFAAMNDVFGPVFNVAHAETAEPGAAAERAASLSNQFIFDCQTHFVRDDYTADITNLRQFAKEHWNPGIEDNITLDMFKFSNYIKEIFVDSDTKIALLSGTPVDDEENLFLTNDQIAAARQSVNTVAGSRRMLSHGIIQPGSPDFMDAVDYVLETLQPDSWKGYTIGDPLFETKRKSNWRLDDEKRVYPFYEKAVKSGITNICIHKGLMPADYRTSWPDLWQYATVWDVGQAAKDWPELNFIIYHSALRPFTELPEATLDEFEKTGRIEWSTDLAEIPEKWGVDNVYAELGSCFATTSVTHPRLAAAMVGQLIQGLGADKVIWGTDSVWYGSPQWQIEAMRRLEVPEDLQKKHGFAPLGGPTSPVKNAIFAGNAARLYGLELDTAMAAITSDEISSMKAKFVALNEAPSNLRYGYVQNGEIA